MRAPHPFGQSIIDAITTPAPAPASCAQCGKAVRPMLSAAGRYVHVGGYEYGYETGRHAATTRG